MTATAISTTAATLYARILFQPATSHEIVKATGIPHSIVEECLQALSAIIEQAADGRITTRTGRRASGVLDREILDLLRTRASDDLGPWEIGNGIAATHGAARSALLRLSRDGHVIKTNDRPARYRLA